MEMSEDAPTSEGEINDVIKDEEDRGMGDETLEGVPVDENDSGFMKGQDPSSAKGSAG